MRESEFFEADVQSALEGGVPVLALFTAGWCGSCEVFEPVFQDVVSHLGESVRPVIIDTDERPELAERFRITAVPTTLVIRDDASTTVSRGPLSRRRLLAELKQRGIGA